MTRDKLNLLKRGDWVELEYQREVGKVQHFGAQGVTKPVVKSQRGAAATEYVYLIPQGRYYRYQSIRRKAAPLTDEEVQQVLLARRMRKCRSSRFEEYLMDAIRNHSYDQVIDDYRLDTGTVLQIIMNLLAEEGRIPVEGWRAWYRCSEEGEMQYLPVRTLDDGIAQVQELKNYQYTKESDLKFGDIEIAECGLEICVGGIWVEWLESGTGDVHEVLFQADLDKNWDEQPVPGDPYNYGDIEIDPEIPF